jgi:hypothetical protein
LSILCTRYCSVVAGQWDHSGRQMHQAQTSAYHPLQHPTTLHPLPKHSAAPPRWLKAALLHSCTLLQPATTPPLRDTGHSQQRATAKQSCTRLTPQHGLDEKRT